jgi:hypothetical protein
MALIMIKNGNTMENIVKRMGGGVATLKDDKKSDTNMYRWTNYHSIALKTIPPSPLDPQPKSSQSYTTQSSLKPNPNRQTTKEGDSELTTS